MADLVEIAQWEEGVYQLETSDPVMGGPDGVDNRQAKQLANRTRYLRAQQEAHAGAENPHPQYATLVAMQAAIAALVNSSPATLNTLKELADALGDDPNFATTVTNALALKAALDSPEFTGTPKAPTPAQFDNTTRLATMAALRRQGLQASGIIAPSTSQALTPAIAGGTVLAFSVSPITLTLPAVSSFPVGGRIEFLNISAGAATVARTGNDTIALNATGGSTSIVLNNGDTLTLEASSTGQWYAVGGSAQLGFSTAFNASLSAAGYQKLPSGLILQWGTSTIATQSMQTVTLPVAYPNAFILAAGNTGTVITPNAASISLGFQGNGSKTSFNVIAGTASSGSTGISWISIGY
ncbi:UNVERIFIED_ORG: hypothetical protein ABIC62_001889 [Burkholderia sp. 1595]|uniref:Putative tail fiber protein gp53-like C-terminal domain-containing protein n=1 Tax=Paraburkholderia terricola TaxID=169427 RepID=A0ABU1LP69_9BURK|nr:hypothetical protein [Paraburkholderia terricola]MDR6408499.1 hypothetical protein [Paraburkholderia terricola]